MSVATAIDWDEWRSSYDDMDFADQQAFYRLVAQLHPTQQSFDPESANGAFDVINGLELSVVELGGWDGRLASGMLTRADVGSWDNYDLLEVPQVCTHLGYRLLVLDDYIWKRPIVGDVFVACHTVEHLRVRELAELFDALRTFWVYLEAPITQDGADWTGYRGSHILEVGWREIGEMLSLRGYTWEGGSSVTGLWSR